MEIGKAALFPYISNFHNRNLSHLDALSVVAI